MMYDLSPYKDRETYPTCAHYGELLSEYARRTGKPLEECREIVGLWTYRDWRDHGYIEATTDPAK